MGDSQEPTLRKKSLARMKNKHKDQIYGNKRVRELERLVKKPHKLGAKLTIRNVIA
jgi:hypothetical protein